MNCVTIASNELFFFVLFKITSWKQNQSEFFCFEENTKVSHFFTDFKTKRSSGETKNHSRTFTEGSLEKAISTDGNDFNIKLRKKGHKYFCKVTE